MLAKKRGEPLGLARLWLILTTTDPEPVEFGNLFFLAIVIFTYFPTTDALLNDAYHLGTMGLLATIGLGVGVAAVYAILWQPCSVLRRMTLMAKAVIWTIIGLTVGAEYGYLNVRTAFCAALTLSSLWAAYRVGKRPL